MEGIGAEGIEEGEWSRRIGGHGNRRNRGRRMMDDGRGIECIGAGGWLRRNGGHGSRRNRGRMMVEEE